MAQYTGVAGAAGLDWPTIAALDEAGLQHRLLAAPMRASGLVPPEYGRIHQELRRKGQVAPLTTTGPFAGARPLASMRTRCPSVAMTLRSPVPSHGTR